jgi:hypothetical protein
MLQESQGEILVVLVTLLQQSSMSVQGKPHVVGEIEIQHSDAPSVTVPANPDGREAPH